MASPLLPLKEGPKSRFTTELIRKLKTHKELARVIRTWKVYEGDIDDDAEPTVDQMPCIRIMPSAPASSPISVGLSREDLVLDIEIFIGGTHRSDPMNLWDAIRLAVYPRDESMAAVLRRDGIDLLGEIALENAAFGRAQVSDSLVWIAKGQIRVGSLVNTRL